MRMPPCPPPPPRGVLGEGGHHSSPDFHPTPQEAPNPTATPRAELARAPLASTLGKGPPTLNPCPRCGCPRRGEQGPAQPHRQPGPPPRHPRGVRGAGRQNQVSGTRQRRGHPRWSRVPPAGTFPRKSRPVTACPGSPAGEGLPAWQRGDAGGTRHPVPRRGDRRAPGGAAPGAAWLSGDGTIR